MNAGTVYTMTALQERKGVSRFLRAKLEAGRLSPRVSAGVVEKG